MLSLADKALSNDQRFAHRARSKSLRGQFRSAATSGSARPKRSLVRITLRTSNQWALYGRVHAGSSTNSRVDITAVADQFIGQGCRCRQRCRLRQNSDVFQQAFNLFANDIRMTQTIKDIELIFTMASSVAKRSPKFILRPAPPADISVMPADAESTTKRTLASESTISALRLCQNQRRWRSPNLETTISVISTSCREMKTRPWHKGVKQKPAANASNVFINKSCGPTVNVGIMRIFYVLSLAQ